MEKETNTEKNRKLIERGIDALRLLLRGRVKRERGNKPAYLSLPASEPAEDSREMSKGRRKSVSVVEDQPDRPKVEMEPVAEGNVKGRGIEDRARTREKGAEKGGKAASLREKEKATWARRGVGASRGWAKPGGWMEEERCAMVDARRGGLWA